jgi:predicted RNase H-like HicB family nuclease
MEYWVRIRRRIGMDTEPNEVMFEARCEMFPDAVTFGDTAEEAYDDLCCVIDDLLPDLAKKIASGR